MAWRCVLKRFDHEEDSAPDWTGGGDRLWDSGPIDTDTAHRYYTELSETLAEVVFLQERYAVYMALYYRERGRTRSGGYGNWELIDYEKLDESFVRRCLRKHRA